MPLAADTRLGPYQILSPLGAGGMGEVYKARDTRLGREVAIKVLPAATAGDSVAEARFEREARAIAAVSHPNICAIHDVGVADVGLTSRATYIVIELLEGETLHQRSGARDDDRGRADPGWRARWRRVVMASRGPHSGPADSGLLPPASCLLPPDS